MNNINELIERAHTQAKKMGWWDEERNVGELLMLIVSECGEALEAHRSGQSASKKLQGLIDGAVISELSDFDDYASRYPEGWSDCFKSYIKDTFEDELADIVIRIADFLGHFEKSVIVDSLDDVIEIKTDNVGTQLLTVTYLVASHPDNIGVSWTPIANGLRLYTAMRAVFEIAKLHNIDLWKHIDLKLKYNLTRGQKHGKAY